ncbi:hypothetical protein C8P63_1601 [Melghirimyces profundicolus]|uniref:Uncharacterized protein n=1 Tax=Melghirimyces profundicolus TaxID=1242148 RepID=A0A2T6ARH6_9BACL|nr:hypothetical protein [Melghirimyces profundicolus]PTX46423.1 hypothetical protein C8P63_1601 [Melghirimyces profundicolus]
MDKNLEHFIVDLVNIIQEKYNRTLRINEDEDDLSKCFRQGENFAYYDVLDLINSQLESFGYDRSKIGKIIPDKFGTKI